MLIGIAISPQYTVKAGESGPPPTHLDSLLLEDGSYLMQEDGLSTLLLETT